MHEGDFLVVERSVKPTHNRIVIYSFMGDWVMFKDIVTGKIPF